MQQLKNHIVFTVQIEFGWILLKISRLWGSAFIACSAIHKSCSSWQMDGSGTDSTGCQPQTWFFQSSSVKKFFFFEKNTRIGFWRWIVQRLPKMQWLWPVGDESSALQWPCRCWARSLASLASAVLLSKLLAAIQAKMKCEQFSLWKS